MRAPNFKYDDEVYGKFGEKDFEEYCQMNGWWLLDVSNSEMYQISDIDFLIARSVEMSHETINGFTDRGLIFDKQKNNRNIYKVEVKTDTRSFQTRNVVYEIISHDFAGAMGASKADYVYYVFVDDSGEKIVKKECWLIDLMKWREYIRTHFYGHKYNETFKDVLNEWGIRTHNYNNNGDKVANLLCNIEKLAENGVAKKLN